MYFVICCFDTQIDNELLYQDALALLLTVLAVRRFEAINLGEAPHNQCWLTFIYWKDLCVAPLSVLGAHGDAAFS